MPSPILAALPAIHVSAIAIGLTIFVGFAIIAYQDFIKLKLSLRDVKLRMISAQSPTTKLPSDNDGGQFLSGFALDWNGKAWPRLKELRGFNHPGEKQDVSQQARDMCHIFYMFFTTYPMLGHEIISTELSENIWKRKNARYDTERHDLCHVRLSKLNNFVERYKSQLLSIAKQCDLIEFEARRKAYDEAIGRIKFPPGLIFDAPDLRPMEYGRNFWEEGVVYYFDLIKQCSQSHDQYKSVVFSYEQGQQNFYIRTLRKPLVPVLLISFLFLVGVILPPVIDVARNGGNFWYPILDYLMLITCAPYFYALWMLARNSRKFFSDE